MTQHHLEQSVPAPRPGRSSRRRSFFVNRRHQLRASLLTAASVLVLLVLLSLVLHSVSVSSTNHVLADHPDLAKVMKAQDRLQLLLILLAAVVFLAGVIVVGILETHRTAGAAEKLTRYMRRVEHGNYDLQLRLRKDDQLQEVQDAFNQMTRALRDRTWHEAESLERFAERATRVVQAEDAQRLAAEIRGLAARKRHSVE